MAYLDTHIIIDAESGQIPSVEWECVSGYLRQTTRYCLSALTVTELLAALAKSDGQYFERHKRRLRLLLAPSDQPQVFDFIPYFTARQLGLEIARPPHLEDDFVDTIKLILAAPSKASLTSGFPHPSLSNQTAKIRIDRFAAELETNQQAYIQQSKVRRELLSGLKRRNTQGPLISMRDWSISLMMTKFNVTPDPDLLDKVAEMFSALYEYEVNFLGLLRNPQFDVKKHLSDLPDAQQLCYLSDPDTFFITNDSDFRNRVHASPQAKRIVKFDDVLRCANEHRTLSAVAC